MHDALYTSVVNEVDCTNLIYNKGNSNAGLEWSARRRGNRPLGARDVARNIETCLGPYATHDCIQSPHTGHNTREEQQASSRRPCGEDQSIMSQLAARTLGRSAIEHRGSQVTVALHPYRPPYFIGGENEDAHIWTSIASRLLDIVQGEPSM